MANLEDVFCAVRVDSSVVEFVVSNHGTVVRFHLGAPDNAAPHGAAFFIP